MRSFSKRLPKTRRKSKNFQEQKKEFLGIYSSALFIEKVMKDSPAIKAGLKENDRIMAVDNYQLKYWGELNKEIQKITPMKGKISLRFEREGKIREVEIAPRLAAVETDLGEKINRYQIGIAFNLTFAPKELFFEKFSNPLIILAHSLENTYNWSALTLLSFVKLFQGRVSPKNLGGPILIGKLAGDSLKAGIFHFLKIMAIISITLGLINLFPIPILDGGYLVFFCIEAIRKKPLSPKTLEVMQQIGIFTIVLVMIFAFYNDIARFWQNIVEVFK